MYTDKNFIFLFKLLASLGSFCFVQPVNNQDGHTRFQMK